MPTQPRSRSRSYPATLQIKVPGALPDAIRVAADRNLMSPSEFVRRALVDRLRAEGFDPAQVTTAVAA